MCALDRERHEELIARAREAGARVMLLTDGDVAAAIAACIDDSRVDLYAGSVARRKVFWRLQRCGAWVVRCRAV